MRYLPIVLFLLLTTQPLFSQSLKAYERAGDEAFERKDWSTAISHYRIVLQRDGDNASVRWKLAESARLYQSFLEADRAYSRLADGSGTRGIYPMAIFQLAEVKKILGNYPEAIALFQRFLAEKHNVPADYLQKAQDQIAACQKAQTLVDAADKDLVIRHPGKEINSPYSDFAPMIAGDTLFFSSYRFDRRTPIGKTKSKITRVLMSVKGSRAREVGRGFPTTDTAHIAHTALTPDGHYMFFTLCKNLNASDIRCELWVTVLDRRSRWLPAQRLPQPVNMPGYTATQPAVGFDSLTHSPTLWFVSDRPGGKGKLDLWSLPLDTNFFCPCNLPLPGNRMGRLPKFATPTNLADLNTAENDGTPYYHSPRQTLYFSSEGWPGMGGYDIFSSRKTALSYTTPQNAGAGLNTSYNDLYFVLRPDGRSGYLSSNRPGSFYLDENNQACCNDLFEFVLPTPKPVAPPQTTPTDTLPALTAKIPPAVPPTPTVPAATAPTTLPQLPDFVGLPLYFDNDEPDKRTRRTTTRKSYGETAQAYFARQEEYRDKFSAGLKGDAADTAEGAVDDFFENEVRRGYDRLGQLCDVLLAHLQSGEQLEVIIKGFTSPRAQTDYNLNLGKRRISSVRNHFETYADGVLKTYIRSGQLRVSEASFGETTVRTGISDNLSDERNSVYHPDASRERRVEIVEIREEKK